MASKRAATVGISSDSILDLGPWLLVGGLLGARITYVISYWDRDFAREPLIEIFRIWNGGLVFYGGLILGTWVGVWRIRQLNLPLWRVADCIAPGVALGHVFGRLGCFMNGCCYGRQSDLPWALRFPYDRVPHGKPVHPTQLYEALLNLALSIALATWFRRRKFDGQVFAFYLVGYALIRSFTEYFRGDYKETSSPLSGVFTPGQSMSWLVLAAGILLYAVLQRGSRLKHV